MAGHSIQPVEGNTNQSRRRRGQRCSLCAREGPLISGALGLCLDCIRRRLEAALRIAETVHADTRHAFDLPAVAPRTAGGLKCPLCARQCEIGQEERGYCGLRTVRGRRLVHLAGTAGRGILEWYRDPLPTNCVADWVCAGRHRGGFHNLAVFYASCTLDRLFCQNWHFRETRPAREPGISAAELAGRANARTFCVCFFGGDPASQMPHALTAARRLCEGGAVVCWETAGTSHPRLTDRALQISLESGGCVTFDPPRRGSRSRGPVRRPDERPRREPPSAVLGLLMSG